MEAQKLHLELERRHLDRPQNQMMNEASFFKPYVFLIHYLLLPYGYIKKIKTMHKKICENIIIVSF
jgi:hypothetical protein